MNKIDISLTTKEVKSEVRSLRSTWNVEMAKYLQSYHQIDGDSIIKEIIKSFRKESRRESIKNIFSL